MAIEQVVHIKRAQFFARQSHVNEVGFKGTLLHVGASDKGRECFLKKKKPEIEKERGRLAGTWGLDSLQLTLGSPDPIL